MSSVETTNQQLFSLLAARTVSADLSEEFCKATIEVFGFSLCHYLSQQRFTLTCDVVNAGEGRQRHGPQQQKFHLISAMWKQKKYGSDSGASGVLKELKLNENNRIETDLACNATGNQVWVSHQAPSRFTIRWYPLLDAKSFEHSTLWATKIPKVGCFLAKTPKNPWIWSRFAPLSAFSLFFWGGGLIWMFLFSQRRSVHLTYWSGSISLRPKRTPLNHDPFHLPCILTFWPSEK